MNNHPHNYDETVQHLADHPELCLRSDDPDSELVRWYAADPDGGLALAYDGAGGMQVSSRPDDGWEEQCLRDDMDDTGTFDRFAGSVDDTGEQFDLQYIQLSNAPDVLRDELN